MIKKYLAARRLAAKSEKDAPNSKERGFTIVETAAGMLTTRLRVGVRTKVAPARDDNHAM